MSYYTPSTRAEMELQRENERLQRDLDTQRWEEQARQEREERDQEDERRRIRDEREAEMHTARDWPDAFAKGLSLISKEAREERSDNIRYADDPEWKVSTWFQDWQSQVERARVLYSEQCIEMERQIEELRRSLLGKVADRLADEFGETETCEALRENRPEFLVNW